MSKLEQFDKEIASITQRRGEVYGHPADDFAAAADLMRHFDHVEPAALRHALRMICVKLARLKTAPAHLDSYVDVVGYARTAVMVIERGEAVPVEEQRAARRECAANWHYPQVDTRTGKVSCRHCKTELADGNYLKPVRWQETSI